MLVVRGNSCTYHRYFRYYTRELYGRSKASLLHLKRDSPIRMRDIDPLKCPYNKLLTAQNRTLL